MPIPTNEQINRWRKRWEKYPDLPSKIADILRGDASAGDDEEEAAHRMWAVNDLLKELNDPEFIVYDGKGYHGFKYRKRYKIPILDLRGIPWSGKYLIQVVLPGVHLEYADLCFSRLEEVDFYRTRLECAWLDWACLEGATFDETHLDGADLRNAWFCKWIDKRDFKPEDLSLKNVCDLIIDVDLSPTTRFANNIYLPRFWDLIKTFRFSAFWRRITNLWFYTNFTGVKIEDADTTLAADLRRYVEDQRYIKRIKDKFPFLYHLWNWSTACGWAAWRVTALSFAAMIFFAFLFANAPLLPSTCVGFSLVLLLSLFFFYKFDWLMKPLFKLKLENGVLKWLLKRSLVLWSLMFFIIGWMIWGELPVSWECWLHGAASKIPLIKALALEPGQSLVAAMNNSSISSFMQWFYISFDIFTNLGIRVDTQPLCDAGVIAMFMETVCGWVALGLLLTVFANKIARRA